MPTLSVVKLEFATIGKWLGLIFGTILLIFLLFKGFIFIKNIVAPAPPPPPEEKFGKLPAIIFPKSNEKELSYKLDTVTGSLPTFSDRAQVFKMVHPEPDLLAVQKASEKVESLGFDPAPQQISDIFYAWKAPQSPFQVLILNVNLAQFTLTSSFASDAAVLSKENFPDEKIAIGAAASFLQTLELYPEDIDEKKTVIKLLNAGSAGVSDATSLSNANLVSVYFFPKDKNNLPFVYPIGHLSSMNLTLGGGEDSEQVIDARFFYQKVSNTSSAYSIKSADEAFDQLKNGEGFIASHDGLSQDVVVKKVYLGYYMSGLEQDFLLPVVVFEGNDNFVAYVPAIKDELIGN